MRCDAGFHNQVNRVFSHQENPEPAESCNSPTGRLQAATVLASRLESSVERKTEARVIYAAGMSQREIADHFGGSASGRQDGDKPSGASLPGRVCGFGSKRSAQALRPSYPTLATK
jgi:hypothetical protein